ncbi:AN1-type zinc finger protein 4 [Syngnathoides biaculeatus]|uniref:AN1-type zinc finger protein 4 n=1 Tax=Syngnathoides biaculeatus TaxID=300417 RepID=UPI002ADE47B3|nr:AN1-type zinc finger protein 4 [Syngnathoides biaculeatus]XP_061693845.1 AN1-type zinc finger protein 4 [Syngnathoides biaculeatus]
MTDRKEPPFFNDDRLGAFHHKLPLYDPMELFIETLTGTCFELRVLPFEAVISVKAKIQRLEGIPVAQQHLIWNNLELDDEHCLHDYGIAEGCTLKLVLAMRGGPINTRRVTMEDPAKEVVESMEGTKEEGWEKGSTNKQVTFVVYREGDQLNFFRVVDRGDGSLTPLSESLSGSSVYNMCTEEDNGGERSAAAQSLENSITMSKMKLLKAKMEDMNINKKPKKTSKAKPRPPVGVHPGGGHPIPSITRLHQRLLRSLPQINPSRQLSAQLPPRADQELPDSSPAGAAAPVSSRSPVSRRPPPSFPSPSCYMLQEEEPWETCAPFAKIRPPPKVSRLDIGGTRLMRDCVYPQLPPLCTRSSPEAAFEPLKPVSEAVGLSLLEEAGGVVAPSQSAASFGELADPLSLNLSSQSEEACRAFDLGAPSQVPLPPSPLSTWTLGTGGDTLTSRADLTQLSTSFHLNPPDSSSPKPRFPSFESTLPLQVRSAGQVKPGSPSPLPSMMSSHAPRLRGVKVESPGKRPELLSKKEPRGVTKMANQACREQLGPLGNSDHLAALSARPVDVSGARRGGLGVPLPPAAAIGQGILGSRLPGLPQDDAARQTSLHRAAVSSYAANKCLVSSGGVMPPFGRIGTPTYHLPPVKPPTGAKKKSSKHCFLCGKKTGLASSYECRCGSNFCAAHRYAETHNCSYDYKGAGRRFLQDANPLVSAPKLPKI